MQFKIMTKNDLDQVARLYVEAFNGAPWYDQWTVEMVKKRLGQMLGCEESLGIIAYHNHQVLGLALGNKEYYYDAIHFHLKEVCVDPTIKGQGIGSKLMDELVKRVEIEGVSEIFLWTLRCNEMQSFYEKQNFKVEDKLMIMKRKSKI